MKVKVTFAIRLGCLALTAALVAAYWLLPDRTLNLLSEAAEVTLYTDGYSTDGGSQARWLNQDELYFECLIIDVGQHRYCGATVKQKGLASEHISLDLTAYTHLNVRIDYQGTASRNLLFYRNTDDASKNLTSGEYDFNRDQYIFTFLEHSDINKLIKLGFDTFDLADWWLQDHYRERAQIRRGKENVTEFGISTNQQPMPGPHRFHIRKLEASGRWLTAQSLYLYILIIWFITVLLEAAVRVTGILQERMELKAEFEKLEETSDRDNLTQVLNRAGLTKAIQSLPTAPEGKHYYLLIFDIDNFKKINDAYGHPAGDSVLCTFADVITANIREDDYFARWGGEEFIVVSCHKSSEHAITLAEKLRKAIETTLFKAGNTPLKVTTSIGAALLTDADDFEQCLSLADQRLYDAKNTGKNKVCISP